MLTFQIRLYLDKHVEIKIIKIRVAQRRDISSMTLVSRDKRNMRLCQNVVAETSKTCGALPSLIYIFKDIFSSYFQISNDILLLTPIFSVDHLIRECLFYRIPDIRSSSSLLIYHLHTFRI